ncbi:MAG: hypothetical protein B6D77_04805 [gamma proteobacterium symbiont of Ctena orbiculata]|nr:MAG: hypothetical protein B6D77_04805 [gamma proteobacterium symbiont of Ctena orbiculata]PVV17563.1 MAG: hypothetical protein B6D78_18485 [gamma proteobacterium symbiont of Ctena orbiculata]
MPLATKISIVIFSLAVCAFAYGYFSYGKYDWIAAKEPINVTTNENYEISFKSQMDANYELELETERNLEFREQNCRLGIETFKKDECGKNIEKLIIQWSISEAGTKIASGKSSDTTSGFWGPNMGKTLHWFQTEKGKEYKVTAQITKTDPSLAVTNPFLKVSIGRMEHKGTFVISSLALYLSYLLAGIAVLTWLFGVVYRWWGQKHNNQSGTRSPL